MNVKKFFIIDAMAMAFRNFHAFGARPLATSAGIPTSAVFGSAQFIMNLIDKERPDFLVIASDSKEATFRHEMYKEYKANRTEMPEDLVTQLPFLNQLYEALNIPCLVKPGWEADDIIGTLVSRYTSESIHCYIVSGDKDFMQLIGPSTFLFSPKKGEEAKIVDSQGVHAKFSCLPSQVIDILALWGDSSDNVPGVRGIGEKGAAKLIAEFGSLENIYKSLEDISNARHKNALIECQKQAFLSKDLVTIQLDVPIETDLDSYKFNPSLALGQKLKNLFEKLEFKQLVNRVDMIAKRIAEPTSLVEEGPSASTSPQKVDSSRYKLIATLEDCDEMLKILGECESFSFDTETTGLDIVEDVPIGISFSPNEGTGYYLPLVSQHLSDMSVEQVFEKLRGFLVDNKALKIGHNLKFDLQMLHRVQIEVSGPFADTMVASYLIEPVGQKHNLDTCCLKYLNYQKIETTSLIGKDKSGSMLDASLEDLTRYACEDADYTRRLYSILYTKLKNLDLEKVFLEVDMPLVPILAEMELAGVFVDASELDTISQSFSAEIKVLEEKIYAEAGQTFNINSTKQLQEIMFEKLKIQEQLGIKNLKKTKSGFSTDISVLERLSKHPLPHALIEYRTLAKLKNTYVDVLPQLIKKKTGRIHTSFHQTVTATGRLSSSQPNLQNIPIRSEKGKKIRKAFSCEEGDHILISADYSQIELRILAHLSQDSELSEAYRSGEDIHKLTAAKIFNIAPNDVTSELRSRAKAINFGIIYGMGPQRLARETGVSQKEAKQFIEKYFASYPKIKDYIDSSVAFAKDKGYSLTLTGRRRPIPEFLSSNRMSQVTAQNVAVNSPVQGTAADLIKLAMIKLQKELNQSKLRAKMLLQVHDELIFECVKEDSHAVSQIIKRCMEEAIPLTVPLVAQVGQGSNWLEAH